jgi:hypothetical protein
MRSVVPFVCLAACGSSFGEGEVTGGFGGIEFGNQISVWHGAEHIVIVDRKLECLDMAWVDNNYFSNTQRSEAEFGAVQFTWDELPEVGTFSIDADAAVTGWRLINLDLPASGEPPLIDYDRAEQGSVVLTDVTPDAITGTFEVLFTDGNAQGSFTSAPCRNVD